MQNLKLVNIKQRIKIIFEKEKEINRGKEVCPILAGETPIKNEKIPRIRDF